MKKPLKFLFKTFGYLIGAIFLYALSVVVFTAIPCNTDFEVTSARNTEIFIVSNGVHTDLLLPTDTSRFIDSTVVAQQNSTAVLPQYVAYGWGDKGFYLETPTWDDLTFKTAFKAATGLSSAAMHVTLYPSKPLENKKNIFKILINDQQLEKLRAYVAKDFKLKLYKTNYINCCWYYSDKRDAFYDAHGTYSLFNTCNVWTNAALKNAGIKTAYWAPFSRCVTYHLK